MLYQIDFVRYYNIDPWELIVSRHTDTKWCSSQGVILESLDLHFEEQPFAQSVKTEEVKRQVSEIFIFFYN